MIQHSTLYSSTNTTSDGNNPEFSFNDTMLESHTLPSVENTAPAIPIRDVTTEVHKFRYWLNSCAIRSLQFHWNHTSDLPFPACHHLPGLPTCALLQSIHSLYWDAPPTCNVTAERLQGSQHLRTSITTVCVLQS